MSLHIHWWTDKFITILNFEGTLSEPKFELYIILDLLCQASALKKETADRVFYLATDLYAIDNPHYHDAELYPYEDVYGQNKLRTPLFNNFSLKVSYEDKHIYNLLTMTWYLFQTTVSPLLSQEADTDPDLFCDSGEFSAPIRDCGGRDFCECIHVLRVNLGDVVEVSPFSNVPNSKIRSSCLSWCK